MLRTDRTGGRVAARPMVLALAIFAIFGLAGCRQDMHDQPRYQAYEKGGMMAPPEGTVARGSLQGLTVPAKAPEKAAGPAKDLFPFEITEEVLARGQNRFNINCAPCHSKLGDGDGLIVRRGFKKPPSYHDDRLRNSPASYFVDVMTNGFGAMPSYADKLTVEDRWKIAAYVRVLQLSQNAKIDDVPAEIRSKLERGEDVSPQSQGGQHH